MIDLLGILPYKEEFIGFDDIKDLCYQFKSFEPDKVQIIFAIYNIEDYSGEAYILFRKCNEDRSFTLYEVHASHCSCCGLEGEWKPEEIDLYTFLGVIKMRDTFYIDKLKEYLGV